MRERAWRDHVATIRPDADVSEADWWDTSWESGTPAAVGFLIPRGFEAYARVLHPVLDDEAGRSVTWASVAAECGTTLHPEAQWSRLAGHRDLDPHGRPERHRAWGGQDPEPGRISRPQFEALADVLALHTATPERTIVAFWVGYGVWPRAWTSGPTSPGPGRESFLFDRPLDDVPLLCAEAPAVRWALEDTGGILSWRSDGVATAPCADELFDRFAADEWQTPSAWWPADHAWATSNDTDLDSTLVGGSRALVDRLLADDRLEVLAWPESGSLWAGADEVNR